MKKMNKKGFTLMEMLIVVAIIAILIAIAVPAFSSQLKKARQSSDIANVRSAYAEAMATALADQKTASAAAAGKMQADYDGKTLVSSMTPAAWSQGNYVVVWVTDMGKICFETKTAIEGYTTYAATSTWYN